MRNNWNTPTTLDYLRVARRKHETMGNLRRENNAMCSENRDLLAQVEDGRARLIDAKTRSEYTETRLREAEERISEITRETDTTAIEEARRSESIRTQLQVRAASRSINHLLSWPLAVLHQRH